MNKQKRYYMNYPLDYKSIYEIANCLNSKKINFFIDFNSICKGFYRSETVLFEINEYLTNNDVSGRLIEELRDYLNNLFIKFRKFDPFFINQHRKTSPFRERI